MEKITNKMLYALEQYFEHNYEEINNAYKEGISDFLKKNEYEYVSHAYEYVVETLLSKTDEINTVIEATYDKPFNEITKENFGEFLDQFRITHWKHCEDNPEKYE